jgi:glutamate synthase domain-containing protein 3
LRAREILDQWAQARAKFVKVLPHEYRRVLSERKAAEDTQATIAKAKTTTTKTRAVPAK